MRLPRSYYYYYYYYCYYYYIVTGLWKCMFWLLPWHTRRETVVGFPGHEPTRISVTVQRCFSAFIATSTEFRSFIQLNCIQSPIFYDFTVNAGLVMMLPISKLAGNLIIKTFRTNNSKTSPEESLRGSAKPEVVRHRKWIAARVVIVEIHLYLSDL